MCYAVISTGDTHTCVFLCESVCEGRWGYEMR